jgi:hypothetical protein
VIEIGVWINAIVDFPDSFLPKIAARIWKELGKLLRGKQLRITHDSSRELADS